MSPPPTSSDLEAFLHRLSIVTAVIGVLLLGSGVVLASYIYRLTGSDPGGRSLIEFYLLLFSLPGLLLAAASRPIWTGRRRGLWVGQVVGGFLVTVYGMMAYHTLRARDFHANPLSTLWLGLAATMIVLVVYLIRGGWTANRLRRTNRPGRSARR
ncbi:MAG: hypothetical protein BIFFINMI_02345 [Phycisphaerae bacterium]|nr:hypothetical protein [Phycisphaerae bacterium]